MGNLNSASAVTEHDRAILQLKRTRDNLHRQQLRLESLVVRTSSKITENMSIGNKKQAILLLKYRKHVEKVLENTRTQHHSIQDMILTVETTLTDRQVLDAMKQGNSTLKQLELEMKGVEGVQQVMDDMRDRMEVQEQIQYWMAGDGIEDQDILDELDELERQQIQARPVCFSIFVGILITFYRLILWSNYQAFLRQHCQNSLQAFLLMVKRKVRKMPKKHGSYYLPRKTPLYKNQCCTLHSSGTLRVLTEIMLNRHDLN